MTARKFFFILFSSYLFFQNWISQNANAGAPRTSTSFNSCVASDRGRDLLDNVCPRLEGTHLDGCCPPIEKKPSIQCTYHIFKGSGQPQRVASSYTKCENGSTVTHQCCQTQYIGCYSDPVVLNFIPRLLRRSNQCCFELCPSATYWRSEPNPNSEITAQHQLTGPVSSLCVEATIETCPFGTTDNCDSSEVCPPVPCTSNCGGGTSGGTNGGGTSGGTSTGGTTGGTTGPPPGGDPGST